LLRREMTEGNPTSQTMTRRSTRVRARIPTLITSLDSAIPFSVPCETLMVNAHGCVAKVSQPLEIGMPVRLRVAPPPANKADPKPRDSREATARIVLCQPIGGNHPSWVAGIEMDKPGNFWGLTPSPEDWQRFDAGATEFNAGAPAGRLGAVLAESVQERLAARESLPSAVRKQLADAQQQTLALAREELFAMLAESVQEQFTTQANAIARLQQRMAAFESVPDEVRKQLAEAQQRTQAQVRETLESSMRNLPGRIREPIAAAVAEALAQAGAEISAQLTREMEALHHRGRMVADELRGAADLLRNEREAASAQLVATAAKREELQLWLAEQQAVYTQQAGRQFEQLAEQQAAYTNEVRQKLEQFASELTARCSAALEKQIRSEVENQAERAEADLDQRLGPMLDRASDLRQEVLSLLGALQRESERCQAQARALLEEKDSADDWIRERAAEFQKTFHDALVETTGQIRGRLNMAVEMIAEPVEKLRDQAAQQLQEQAGRQARQLREDADEAAERLRGLRRDLESTVRESLREQAAETAATFGREIAQAAQRSVDEWRSALAKNLESIAGALNQKLPGEEK